MKKKLVYLCMLSLLSVLLLAGCSKNKNKDNPNYNSDNYLSGKHYVMMEILDYGPIYLELDADAAPATVTNFVNLVNESFYDGLSFHRIISDFMIQGGDPEGNGLGNSAYTVPGEFATNGFENPISHVRGTISMARAKDNDSASCQFFIVHQDSTDLDGYYAAFGKVVAGMSVVDSICANVSVEDNNGTVLAENQPVINVVMMISEEEVPEEDEVVIEIDQPDLPDPKAQITISAVNNAEDAAPVDQWVVDESGSSYLITSTEDLLSLGLYNIDLAEGINYNEDNLLAYSSDVGAGTFISLKISITTDGLPNQLLVAEEHNGAIGLYLLSMDANNGAYLIPFGN